MSTHQLIKHQQLSQSTSLDVFNSKVFRELFEADKNRLYCYIYAYVHDTSWVDDIFQKTGLTLWKEFEQVLIND